MNKKNDFDSIVNKVSEMSDFFKFGGEVLPFLVELFRFLREIIPLMAEANISIQESTQKLTTASDNISKVSQNTEVATQQIMDKLDQITEKLNALPGADQESSPVQKGINEIQNDVFDIMNALQFQDITAQQLEHAHRILTAIYEKFKHIFKSVSKMDVNESFQEKLYSQFMEADNIQQMNDDNDNFNIKTADKVRTVANVTQDDIDNLFD